jgi:parvulin-like peptidyl-prolyl isomerase
MSSKTPTKMRCSHILLSWDKAIDSTHSRDLAFAIHDAKLIIAELMQGGLSWNTAVKEHTACRVSWQNGGDMGWFDENDITTEIWNTCLITPVGEVFPEPVNSPYGIHIIYRTG